MSGWESGWLPVLDGEVPPPGGWRRGVWAGLCGAGRVYGAVQQARELAFARGWFKVYAAPVPVLSVGNLSCGGTGKTPFSIWLGQRLLERGIRPGVVSRGYRQPGRAALTVVATPEGVGVGGAGGDEARLVAWRLPGAAVLTAPRRALAIEHAVRGLGCGAIILDDGFQHLRVARQLDIVLVDAACPFGNGRVVPGGVLREHPRALRRADVVVITRADDPELAAAATRLVQREVPGIPIAWARHRPGGWWQPASGGGAPVPAAPPEGRVVGFCGLARPGSFHRALLRLGLEVVDFRSFSDHHPFCAREIGQLSRHAAQLGATALVCTAKDAVKLDPRWSEVPVRFLDVELEVIRGEEELLGLVERVVALSHLQADSG